MYSVSIPLHMQQVEGGMESSSRSQESSCLARQRTWMATWSAPPGERARETGRNTLWVVIELFLFSTAFFVSVLRCLFSVFCSVTFSLFVFSLPFSPLFYRLHVDCSMMHQCSLSLSSCPSSLPPTSLVSLKSSKFSKKNWWVVQWILSVEPQIMDTAK